MKSLIAGVVVVLAGGVALWMGTDCLRAITAEQARRVAVQKAPQVLPHAVMTDQDGRSFTFADYSGKLVLVDFVYTRCRSWCTALGTGFQQIFRALPPDAAGREVFLLTVSFDPARDTQEVLKRYARYYGADGTTWRVARVADGGQLDAMLRAFGIVILADSQGEFQHNAAIHLVDRQGRLAEIIDFDAPHEALHRVVARL